MRRIVLIDDDCGLRRTLGQFLRLSGFAVAGEAGDGRRGLSLLQRIRPDLIITDCQMPFMDGISMVRTLRAVGDTTPILMLSGQGDPRIIHVAQAAGVNHYLSKPPDPDELLQTIRAYTAARHLTMAQGASLPATALR